MAQFKVTIINTAPEEGVRFTPVWVGFHDGTFDTYNTGDTQTPQLNAIAEDGNTQPISQVFLNESGLVSPVDGTILGATNNFFFPGEDVSETFTLDTTSGNNRYFSYATMVVPSNDAFVSNANPLAHQIIDQNGNSIAVGFTVLGTQVRDGGTEDNDEFPANTAGLAQTVPNTGTTSNNVIVAHPGFIPGGPILTQFPSADFTQEGYQIARVMVTAREDTDTTDNLVPVTVTVENIAPTDGVRLSSFWVGFHDGTFDSYDGGSPSSPELEVLAEDADTSALSTLFNSEATEGLDGTLVPAVGDPPILPGTTVTQDFVLDTTNGENEFFSYVSMIVPSNDAFVANGNPRAHNLFDDNGNFVGAEFIIGGGSEVNDAGTEDNDEFPANTLGLGQTVPNTGQPSSPMNPNFPGQTTITVHPGFIPGGNVLEEIPNGDFTQPDYEVAQIFVTSIEEEVKLVANLTPAQEVPDATDSAASGSAELTLSEDGTSLSYSIRVSGVDFGEFIGDGTTQQTTDTGDDVTSLHFHNGPRGENAPVVFGLIDPAHDPDDLEIVVNGDGSTTISGAWELTDDNGNTSLADFVDEIRGAGSGEDVELYLNLHTEEFPDGEIRGQIVAPQSPTIEFEVDSADLISTMFAYNLTPAGNGIQVTTQLTNDVLELESDAVFDNLVGLYEVANANGGILLEDGTVLLPSDDPSRYAQLALTNRVDSFSIRAGSSGDPNRNTTAEQFGDILLAGGLFYAPFVIANGGTVGFEGFINAENAESDGVFNDAADGRDDLVAYFAFLGANPDGAAHLQSRGNNIFGFEDLPGNLGISDNDFNDAIFQLDFMV